MKKVLVVAGLALASSQAIAADLPSRQITKPSGQPSGDLFFGSLFIGANLLHAPKQTINGINTPSATGGFLNGGGRMTYMPAGSGFGGQVDLNFGAINGAWVNPDAGSQNKAMGLGGTLHVFTKFNQDTKVGAFISGDWTSLRSPGIRVNLPSFVGGIEGHVQINPALMLSGRVGGGVVTIGTNQTLPAGISLPNISVFTGGLGATYAVQPNWTVGADANFSHLSSSFRNISGNATIIDVGLNTEYRFDSVPLAVRADVGWVNGGLNVDGFGSNVSGNAYRAKLTLSYMLGEQPRRLVDREFRSYTVLTGMR
jgi:opacity protein-like surface antigen